MRSIRLLCGGFQSKLGCGRCDHWLTCKACWPESHANPARISTNGTCDSAPNGATTTQPGATPQERNQRIRQAPTGNAVKHFEAERREPSGESITQTHRRARALPLQTQRFSGEKCFTALPNGAAQIHDRATNEIIITNCSALSGLHHPSGSHSQGVALG
jgi:hypothetical protein